VRDEDGQPPHLLGRRNVLHLAVGAAALPAVARSAWGQAYPTRPVRVIVPFAPAGDTDLVARLIGHWLSERLGQPFIIENRPGAGTNIGTEAVVRAPADGYALLLVSPPAAINATLYDKLSFVFLRDMAPVAAVIRAPFVMEVTPSVPAKTVPEFIAYAKFAMARKRPFYACRRISVLRGKAVVQPCPLSGKPHIEPTSPNDRV
jgi:tripartite-type tricarboxylate transporter receptor subunit TctC